MPARLLALPDGFLPAIDGRQPGCPARAWRKCPLGFSDFRSLKGFGSLPFQQLHLQFFKTFIFYRHIRAIRGCSAGRSNPNSADLTVAANRSVVRPEISSTRGIFMAMKLFMPRHFSNHSRSQVLGMILRFRVSPFVEL